MKNFLLVALAVVAGFLLGTACGPPVSKCASTCLGCCDTSGECQPGSAFSACGQGGSTCRSCSATETCSLNVCSSSGSGGGNGGGTGGGGTATGGGTGGGSTGGGVGGGSTGGGGGSTGGGGGGSIGGGSGGGSTGGGTGGGSTGGGTGGGSTGGGTGGGSIGGGTGGGSIGGGTGGGSTGTPPDINVTIGSCGMVTPCTGGLPGTWFYTTACNDDPYADYRQLCPTLSTVSNNTTLSGRIDFGTSSVTRSVTTNYSSVVNVPASCNSLGCTTIQSFFPVGTSCVANGGGCNCTLSGSSTLTETGTWTANNGVITVVTPSTTRSFNSCVAVSTQTTMLLRENGTSVPSTERGTTLLTKQ